MSSPDLIGRTSAALSATGPPDRRDSFADQRHASLDIERRLHTGQRQAELDERDRHGRTHADDDRLRVENARDRGDVVEHATDEAVYDLERGNVYQHALRASLHDLLRKIVLERDRKPVVHVDLYRDEQRIAHLQNRDSIHESRTQRGAAVETSTTVRPMRSNATAKASARLDFVTTTRSTPKCTIVCAICGRIPLTMRAAPIKRAAATVLSRCCATRVSTVGSPAMSMIAISAP